MAKTREQTHWLVHVLRRARVAGADRVEVGSDAPVEEAWSEAREASGLTDGELATLVADYFRLGTAALDRAVPGPTHLVAPRFARRHGLVPLRTTDRALVVATADPTDFDAHEALELMVGGDVVLEVAPPARIRNAIEEAYPEGEGGSPPSPRTVGEEHGVGGKATLLGQVGLPEWELGRLRQLLARRDGLVCVTGPAGAGKTTILHAALTELSRHDLRLISVEEAVAYPLPGVTQLQAGGGLGLADALRTVLREDPDVVMVDPIADRATASAAVEAALSGRLVLAALDVGEAVAVVDRLAELGVERERVGSALRGAIALRRVRRLCPECAQPIAGALSDEELRLARRHDLRPTVRPAGCRSCADRGYRGSVPVAEVFTVNDRISDLITAGADAPRLRESAVSAGMRPLVQVAIEAVRAGITTLEAVDRELGAAPTSKEAASGRGREGGSAPPGPGAVSPPSVERSMHWGARK